jgi:hypothetical protein
MRVTWALTLILTVAVLVAATVVFFALWDAARKENVLLRRHLKQERPRDRKEGEGPQGGGVSPMRR